MPVSSGQTTSLSRILAGSPLPRLMPTKDPEIDARQRAVNLWMDRLSGLLTNQNIFIGDLRTIELNGFIRSPVVLDYTLIEYAEYSFYLRRVTHKTSSGGCTIAIKIDGSTATGTGDSTPSSTQGVLSFLDTQVLVGQRVQLAVSALSAPANLAFTLKRERIL